jgi:hydroxyacylglutathione hydrolase
VSDTPILALVDEGLGNSSYLIDLGDGRALALDPSRDLRAVRAAAAARGLRVAYSAETHLHADFLSGSVQLAADGAQVLASAAGRRSFDHRGLGDDDEVDLGGLTLRALVTLGHTPEHLSYLLLDGTALIGVFTGGSLLVGAAPRTDLAGAERTEELARAQYRSLQRLARLPDATGVYPTHGAGSLCSAPPGAERTSTIGAQRATNPYLAVPDEDAFVALLLGSLGSYPPYFARLGEDNRRGPALLDADPVLAPLSPLEVEALRASGAEVIDVRPYEAYAHAHLPGSLSIPLRPVFATWLGWLLPSPATPLVIVRDPDQDPAEVVWQALKIGYEQLAGELSHGLGTWTGAGRPLASTRMTTPAAADPTTVIDVRQTAEFATGHLPGAANIELGSLGRESEALSGGDVVVMCGHGERAATAASVLERAGVTDVAILTGGPQDWADAAAGRTLQVQV